jgi:hypothetical protein
VGSSKQDRLFYASENNKELLKNYYTKPELQETIKSIAGSGFNEDRKRTEEWVGTMDLQETLKAFSGRSTASYGNKNSDTANDRELSNLLGNLSEEDKKRSFVGKRNAFIISESGQVIGEVDPALIVNLDTLTTDPESDGPVIQNSQFQIIQDLGIDKYAQGQRGLPSSALKAEEATGGRIKFNGKEYDVMSTVIDKQS